MPLDNQALEDPPVPQELPDRRESQVPLDTLDSLVPWAQSVQLVHRDPEDSKVSLVHRDPRATQEWLAHQGPREQRAIQVPQVTQVRLVSQELPVLLDLLDLWVLKAAKAIRDIRELQDLLVPTALPVQRAIVDSPGHLVRVVRMEFLEEEAQLALLDPLDLLVSKVTLATLDLPAQQEPWPRE